MLRVYQIFKLLVIQANKRQYIITKLQESMKVYGMKINVEKTTAIRLDETENVKVMAEERKEKYIYLGSMSTVDWKSEIEEKRRISMAKIAFNKNGSGDEKNCRTAMCEMTDVECGSWARERSSEYRLWRYK